MLKIKKNNLCYTWCKKFGKRTCFFLSFFLMYLMKKCSLYSRRASNKKVVILGVVINETCYKTGRVSTRDFTVWQNFEGMGLKKNRVFRRIFFQIIKPSISSTNGDTSRFHQIKGSVFRIQQYTVPYFSRLQFIFMFIQNTKAF